MRVVVEIEGRRYPAWGWPTLQLGDRVLVEGNPLRIEQAREGVVVHIGPGSLPVRRVLELLERFGDGPYGREWPEPESEFEIELEDEETR